MYCCVLKAKEDEEDKVAEETPTHIKHVPDKYTLTRNGRFYLFWQPIMVCANLITNIIYPTYTILSFEAVEDKDHGSLRHFSDNSYEEGEFLFYVQIVWNLIRSLNQIEIVLVVCESFFLINMIMNFFLQGNYDSMSPKREPLPTIAYNYLCGKFFFDLIVLLPVGYILAELVDHRLRFFWALKGLRVTELNYYISDKFWGYRIRSYYSKLREWYIRHGNSENDIDDRLFIEYEIYSLNIQKIIRMALQLLFACYFFGIYWYVYSETIKIYMEEYMITNNIDDEVIHPHLSWVDNGENWTILNKEINDKVVTSIYFASTTLSTVGFGDFYPVNNQERLFGALLIFFFQMGFSFIST